MTGQGADRVTLNFGGFSPGFEISAGRTVVFNGIKFVNARALEQTRQSLMPSQNFPLNLQRLQKPLALHPGTLSSHPSSVPSHLPIDPVPFNSCPPISEHCYSG